MHVKKRIPDQELQIHKSGRVFNFLRASRLIAVGSNNFVEAIRDKLGVLAKGRKVIETTDGFQLREEISRYNVDFNSKKEDIGGRNTYFLDINH